MPDINYIHSEYPSVEYLIPKAKKRMPGFAWDYLTAGCFGDNSMERNKAHYRDVLLQPYYLRNYPGADLEVILFSETYSAPFGIAPVGLQSLMWPGSCEILAKAAAAHNIPFILSTVGTADIETIAEITEGKAWFQLYHPAENDLRDRLLERTWAAGIKTLVILADTPTFAYRPREIRNGLSIPPRMSLRNVMQMFLCPSWCMGQLAHGKPDFKSMTPYLPKGLSMKHLGMFMNETFSGRLNADKIKALRDKWKGNLVIKGIVNHEDANSALKLGVDGFIVSNHGGRQLDSGESTIVSLRKIASDYRDKTMVMIDGGINEGSDIANALACGAHFTFLGRAPMYGVCALGKRGGTHTIAMLKKQLTQVMEQVGCDKPWNFSDHPTSN